MLIQYTAYLIHKRSILQLTVYYLAHHPWRLGNLQPKFLNRISGFFGSTNEKTRHFPEKNHPISIKCWFFVDLFVKDPKCVWYIHSRDSYGCFSPILFSRWLSSMFSNWVVVFKSPGNDGRSWHNWNSVDSTRIGVDKTSVVEFEVTPEGLGFWCHVCILFLGIPFACCFWSWNFNSKMFDWNSTETWFFV